MLALQVEFISTPSNDDHQMDGREHGHTIYSHGGGVDWIIIGQMKLISVSHGQQINSSPLLMFRIRIFIVLIADNIPNIDQTTLCGG